MGSDSDKATTLEKMALMVEASMTTSFPAPRLFLHLPITCLKTLHFSRFPNDCNSFVLNWSNTSPQSLDQEFLPFPSSPFNFVIPSKESSLSIVEFLLAISRFLLLAIASCLSVIVSLTFEGEWVANTG